MFRSRHTSECAAFHTSLGAPMNVNHPVCNGAVNVSLTEDHTPYMCMYAGNAGTCLDAVAYSNTYTCSPMQTLKGQSGELNLECQDFDVFATL